MGFEIFGFGKKKPVEEQQPPMDEMGGNDQAFQAEAEAGMFTVERDRSGLESTDPDAINYVVPDMSGLGEPTQEKPKLKERIGLIQEGEDAINYVAPDISGLGEPAQPPRFREPAEAMQPGDNPIEWQDPDNLPSTNADSINGWDGRLQEGRDEAAFKQNHRAQP